MSRKEAPTAAWFSSVKVTGDRSVSVPQCEDQKVECLYEALKRAGDRTLGAFPSAVPLVLHSSISYLGFFVDDSPADVIREFAVMFATEASILAGRQPWAVVHAEPWFTDKSPFVPGAELATLGCWGWSPGPPE